MIVLHSFIFCILYQKLMVHWSSSFFLLLFWFCYSIQFDSIVWIFFFSFAFLRFSFFLSPILGSLAFVTLCHIRFDLSDDLALYQNNYSNNNYSTQTNCIYFAVSFTLLVLSSLPVDYFSLLVCCRKYLFFLRCRRWPLSSLLSFRFEKDLHRMCALCTLYTVHRALYTKIVYLVNFRNFVLI